MDNRDLEFSFRGLYTDAWYGELSKLGRYGLVIENRLCAKAAIDDGA